jgi:hypothetical protein
VCSSPRFDLFFKIGGFLWHSTGEQAFDVLAVVVFFVTGEMVENLNSKLECVKKQRDLITALIKDKKKRRI